MQKNTRPAPSAAPETPDTAHPMTVTRSMKRRAVAVACVMLLLFGAVVTNLVKYQIINTEEYRAKATGQQLRDEKIVPSRGNIYDSEMNLLATSATVWTVTASPRDMAKANTNLNDVAFRLAEILDLDTADLLEKFQDSDSNYKMVKRQIEKPLADEINNWIAEYNAEESHKGCKIAGIYLTQDSKRYYPYGNLASTVIGFVNVDGDGLAGLEYYYNDTLAGVPGRKVSAKNALGYDMPVGDYEAEYDAQDGNSLVLTINEFVQQSADKHLAAAIAEHNVANRGVCIVMDVNTGAVLAMSTMGDYDLNDPYTISDKELAAEIDAIPDEEQRNAARSAARQAQWRNKAIADSYEPGSVFKVVTAAGALDSGKATLETSFGCSGSYNIAGTTMRCAHTEGHGMQNFYAGLNNSCNPYYIQLGQRMGSEVFCQYLQGFGFGQKTGIDLPSETAGSVYPLERMGPVELASSSFGQSSSVTPLQMITAVSAAVNGGYLMQPYIVSQVLDENGNIISTTKPVVKRQVISEETSAELADLLYQSVETGSNTKARVAGYKVGGKSGTSQKLNTDQALELRIASFVAFAPADDPQIAVLVMLDEPHSPTGSSYGGRLAAPVCGNVLAEVLPYLGIDTHYTEEQLAVKDLRVANLLGRTPSEAQVELNGVGFNYKIVGSGTTVTYQYPAAGTYIPRQSTVILYTDEGAAGTMVTVPNVAGKTVAMAREMLRAAGLNLDAGSALDSDTLLTADSQSIAEGEQVEMGTVIAVSFSNASATD